MATSDSSPESDDSTLGEANESTEEYNYDRFDFEYYLSGVDRDVEVGEEAVDVTVYDREGNERQLSDLWDERPAVIEFGSITCPIFTYEVPPMEELAAKYDGDVDFYVLYVREAHPASNYPAHDSIEEKIQTARECEASESIDHRELLVDNVEGTTHTTYGPLPNSVYLVGTDGLIAYRADWVDPDHLDEQIQALLDCGGCAADMEEFVAVEDNFHSPSFPLLKELYRVFKRAGVRSAIDFLLSLPRRVFGNRGNFAGLSPPDEDVKVVRNSQASSTDGKE